MKIEENRVYVFQFDAQEMGGGCSFPMRGETREAAVEALQKCLGRFQTELAMEFPKVSGPSLSAPASFMGEQVANSASPEGIPPEVLEMRIDTLLADLGGKDLAGIAKAETIKLWTGNELTPVNYAKIITELELIASGQKEITPKKKKA